MLTPTLNLPTITQEVALNTIRFNRAFGQFESRITMLGRQMSSLGISLSLALSIPLQLIAGSAVRNFALLDDAVTKAFSRITGAGAGVKEAFRLTAISMSASTKFAAHEVAEGLDELVKAGLGASQAIQALPIATNLAVAGDLSMAKSVEYLMDILSAMRMRTGDAAKDIKNLARISDVLTASANATTASVESMALAFTHKAAASAGLAGKSVEEVGAILMAYHAAGTKAALAGERYNVMQRDMQRQAQKNSEVWEKYVDIYDAQTGAIRPWSEILIDLQVKLSGATDKERELALEMLKLPSRSMIATQTLMGLGNQIKSYQKFLEQAGGTTKSVAEVQMTSFTNKMLVLRNQVRAVGFDIVSVMMPAMMQFAGWISKLVVAWNQLTIAQKRFYVSLLAIASAIGPLLILVGLLVRALGGLAIGLLLAVRNVITLAVSITVALVNALVWVVVQITTVIILMNLFNMTLLQTIAHLIRYAVAATVAWLASFGPIGWGIGLIMALSGVVFYLAGGFEWLGRKIKEALGWLVDFSLSGLDSEMDKLMTKIDDMMNKNDPQYQANKAARVAAASMGMSGAVGAVGGLPAMLASVGAGNAIKVGNEVREGIKDGIDQSSLMEFLTHPEKLGLQGALLGQMTGVGGILGGFGAAAAFAALENDFAQYDPVSKFDESLLEPIEEDKKDKGARGSSIFERGYNATELGTAEEYRARVQGQQALIQLSQKQLNAGLATVDKLKGSNELLARIDQKIGTPIELKEANV